MDNDWKKVSIDGKVRIMRRVELPIKVINFTITPNKEQDFTEEEKKRNEETKVVPQDGFFEFKK